MFECRLTIIVESFSLSLPIKKGHKTHNDENWNVILSFYSMKMSVVEKEKFNSIFYSSTTMKMEQKENFKLFWPSISSSYTFIHLPSFFNSWKNKIKINQLAKEKQESFLFNSSNLSLSSLKDSSRVSKLIDCFRTNKHKVFSF